jgi:hypothetical protein
MRLAPILACGGDGGKLFRRRRESSRDSPAGQQVRSEW